jgi:hypothetical protein
MLHKSSFQYGAEIGPRSLEEKEPAASYAEQVM